MNEPTLEMQYRRLQRARQQSEQKKKNPAPEVWFAFRTGRQTAWGSTPNDVEFLMTVPSGVELTAERAQLLREALTATAQKTMAPWLKSTQQRKR